MLTLKRELTLIRHIILSCILWLKVHGALLIGISRTAYIFTCMRSSRVVLHYDHCPQLYLNMLRMVGTRTYAEQGILILGISTVVVVSGWWLLRCLWLTAAWICPPRVLSESDDDEDKKAEKLRGPSYHEEQEAIRKRWVPVLLVALMQATANWMLLSDQQRPNAPGSYW